MPNITITINRELLEDCATALRYKAYDEAAISQQPALFDAEDTLEWSQALQLDALIQQAAISVPATYHIAGFKERRDVLAFPAKV